MELHKLLGRKKEKGQGGSDFRIPNMVCLYLISLLFISVKPIIYVFPDATFFYPVYDENTHEKKTQELTGEVSLGGSENLV
jgi:hypothetical protein